MLYQRLLVLAAAATYLVIVLGAVVRVTGSGLGCPDWPRCHGQWVPPPEPAAMLEFSHRLVAALDSALVLAVVGATWLFRRRQATLLVAATALPLLLAGQIALGAVTVALELPPWIVLVHLLTAMAILGLLVWMAVAATTTAREGEPWRPAARSTLSPSAGLRVNSAEGMAALSGEPSLPGRLAVFTTGAAFLLLASGSTVRATGASWACAGFPACNGQLLPIGAGTLVEVHLVHRLLALGFLALLAYFLGRAWAARAVVPGLRWAVLGTGAAAALQLAIGIAGVNTAFPATLRGAHVAAAAALWAGLVVITAALHVGQAPSPAIGRGALRTVAAYLSLTKPGIIVLLLITTATSMMIAARGIPPIPLMLATLMGGALSAGAANTFNCYLDRDIDALMARTARRPLVAGVLRPGQALRFGLALAMLSVLVLSVLVNWLAAALSLCGLLYYVFVYTCWLKRSTPSNIVIGGAAGAVPPLVGWAAVTGEVSLLAVYLFAVIFFWTPPHFWALALLIRREYERAHIPMLPNVRGEDETRQQIVVYSLVLVGLTLAVVVFRQVGVFYVTAAALLGGVFVYHAVRLLREATQTAARRLFRYSILYLGLLFLALVVDQWGGT